ncbi:MAG: S8 family serine peptidase, partial [Bacillota bacterium]|nr:S8 family serine peptidase [Bacillota bacterium]
MYSAIVSSPVNTKLRESAETAARYEGCAVEFVLPRGILIKGSRRQLILLEKKGYRVKLLRGTDMLTIGDFEIKTDRGDVPIHIPENYANWTHYLIQLIAPPLPQWVSELEQKGLDVVEPIGAYGLFVVCSREQIMHAAILPYVAWVGPFLPKYRIHRSLHRLQGHITYLSIAIYPPHKMSRVIETVLNAGATLVRKTCPESYYRGQYGELLIAGDAALINLLAAQPDVRWLEYAPPRPGLEGEREAQIAAGNLDNRLYPHRAPLPGYGGWLQSLGLAGGSGVKIAICDTGVDANREQNRLGHADLRGRQYAFVDYRVTPDSGECVDHGTHVASIAVGGAVTGQKDNEGFLRGQGMAPHAEYINQNILAGPWPPDWAAVVRDAVIRGAAIINNSWCAGSGTGDGYTLAARTFDRLVCDAVPGYARPRPVTIVFSSGNSGPEPYSITPPKEAKNVIVVGNSLGWQTDKRFHCADIRGVFGASSRGPAKDGRVLPTVVAPGTDVAAALAPGSRRTPITGTVQKDVKNPAKKQSSYVFMTGTSMSAALVSGACAVITEWWQAGTGGRHPSPSLLKALLVNGAEDQAGGQDWRCLNGNKKNNIGWTDLQDGRYCRPLEYLPLLVLSGFEVLCQRTDEGLLRAGEWYYSFREKTLYVRLKGSSSPTAPAAPLLSALAPHPLGNLPDNVQGWGRVTLNNIFLQSPAVNRGKITVLDGEHVFTASGQEYIMQVAPVDAKFPLRVTLAWTDPAAAVGSGSTLV